MHIGTAFVIGSKVGDRLRVGFHAIIFLADWHAYMLYRDVAPKLGWKQVVALHTPLLPALDGGGRMDLVAGKMSKSRPDASILLNDGPREVERKIGKAFCPAKEPVGNPVLEIARLILFPRRGKLMIPRDPKFGGDVVYESVNELAKSYANGELHPKDLKAGVTAGLNGELAPVRKYFEAHPENLEAVQRITRAG